VKIRAEHNNFAIDKRRKKCDKTIVMHRHSIHVDPSY